MFDNATPPTNCDANLQLYRGATAIADAIEFGTSTPAASQYIEASYTLQRLVSLPAGAQTITARGYREYGAGTCTVYAQTMTAVLVGSGAGAQPSAAAPRAPRGGPPR